MRAFAATLLLALTACGDEGPKITVNGRPVSVPTTPSGMPSGLPSGADLERLQAGNDKAAALGARPLTATDIERFLAVKAAAGNDPSRMEAALSASDLTLQEWRVLSGRIPVLMTLLTSGASNNKLAADLATAKPFLERLQAAMKAK